VTKERTIKAKHSFKAYSHSHGVTIKHYHANNGRFAKNTFMNHCAKCHQMISFAGVNAHFQNALAEKRIHNLQDSACTMLVHAKHCWPQAISAHLWLYALHMANNVNVHAPLQSGKSPTDHFAKIASTMAPKHFHAFGCPVYMLTERMQQGGKGSKWEE
jgi:hypothetical protein